MIMNSLFIFEYIFDYNYHLNYQSEYFDYEICVFAVYLGGFQI